MIKKKVPTKKGVGEKPNTPRPKPKPRPKKIKTTKFPFDKIIKAFKILCSEKELIREILKMPNDIDANNSLVDL